MTLKRIRLQNFKGFRDVSLPCSNFNCIVGPNNAGKSSTLDALRILDDVLRFAKRRVPRTASADDGEIVSTHHFPNSLLSVPAANLSHNYSDDHAKITYFHQNGKQLDVFLHSEDLVRVELRGFNRPPITAAGFMSAFPIKLVIVPTLGPLEDEERYVTDKTADRNKDTRLAHRSFRNIVRRLTVEEFETLQVLTRETWDGVKIEKPSIVDNPAHLIMMYEEKDRIPREVHWAGFGFQIWLQILLQLMRGDTGSAVLVMDEPDIYLHADLQRRLVRIAKKRFAQIFMATHSAEIVNELELGEIISVSRNDGRARRVQSDEAYRKLFSYLGSSENAEFARLARSKRVIFFEGEDRKLLRKMMAKHKASNAVSNTDTLILSTDGYSNWHRIRGVDWTLRETLGIDVKIAALFDSDYRCEEETEEFLSEAGSASVLVRVLERKEIENYLLNPDLLRRVILRRFDERGRVISEDEANAIWRDVAEEFKHPTEAKRAGAKITYAKEKGLKTDPSTIIAEVHADIESRWSTDIGILSTIPGKKFISRLSAVLQEKCGATISPVYLASNLLVGEFDPELMSILSDFEEHLID